MIAKARRLQRQNLLEESAQREFLSTCCLDLMGTSEEDSLSVALMFLNNTGKSALLHVHNQQVSFQGARQRALKDSQNEFLPGKKVCRSSFEGVEQRDGGNVPATREAAGLVNEPYRQ